MLRAEVTTSLFIGPKRHEVKRMMQGTDRRIPLVVGRETPDEYKIVQKRRYFDTIATTKGPASLKYINDVDVFRPSTV